MRKWGLGEINNRGGVEISGLMGFTRFAFTAIACFASLCRCGG